MSDVSATVHNLEALFGGKITWEQFANGELALLEANIHSAPTAAQAALNVSLASLEAGAQAALGLAQTAVGPILAESTSTQVTQVMTLLKAVGIPTSGPLTLVEQAMLTQLINGLKAGLDRIGIQVSTQA